MPHPEAHSDRRLSPVRGIAVLLLAATVGLAGCSAPSSSSDKIKVEKSVRDGAFEFTVHTVQCDFDKVGNRVVFDEPAGQYCLVKVTVRNVGTVTRMFNATEQRAYDATGKEYRADAKGSAMASGGGDAFLNSIEEGTEDEGTLAFDIPKDQRITKLELHDSLFSDGGQVSIG